MPILKIVGCIVGGVVVTGVVIFGVVAHELGEYIKDVYDPEDWWQ